jgi:hypothetical protein
MTNSFPNKCEDGQYHATHKGLAREQQGDYVAHESWPTSSLSRSGSPGPGSRGTRRVALAHPAWHTPVAPGPRRPRHGTYLVMHSTSRALCPRVTCDMVHVTWTMQSLGLAMPATNQLAQVTCEPRGGLPRPKLPGQSCPARGLSGPETLAHPLPLPAGGGEASETCRPIDKGCVAGLAPHRNPGRKQLRGREQGVLQCDDREPPMSGAQRLPIARSPGPGPLGQVTWLMLADPVAAPNRSSASQLTGDRSLPRCPALLSDAGSMRVKTTCGRWPARLPARSAMI